MSEEKKNEVAEAKVEAKPAPKAEPAAVVAEQPELRQITLLDVVEISIKEMLPEVKTLLGKFGQIGHPDALKEQQMRFAVFHWMVEGMALELAGGNPYTAKGLLDSVREGFNDFYKRTLIPLEPSAGQPVKVEKK